MDKASEQLMLIGGTALVYPQRAGEILRQAAFDSILYAQLVANKHAGSRFEQYDAWYAANREAFRQLGWIKLASTHDLKQLGQPVRSTQLQPLEAWLKMRAISPEALLTTVRAGLRRSAQGVGHLLKFSAQEQGQRSRLVVEVGLLKAGPTLDLCAITLQVDERISAVPLNVLLSEQVLRGEAEFDGISLALDNGRFEHQRTALQALMEDRNARGDYRFDPYAPVVGATP
ncbi:hypothetical protein [Pseudomonas juntendi]